MRIKDVVAQLLANLPRHTDEFSEFPEADVTLIKILSARRIRIEFDGAHGIVEDKSILINGMKLRNDISVAKTKWTPDCDVDLEDQEMYLEFSSEHDYTEEDGIEIEVAGFTDTQFNGTYTLSQVIDRNSIIIDLEKDFTGIKYPEDTGYIFEERDYGGNGVVTVDTVGNDWIEYDISEKDPNLPYVTGINYGKDAQVIKGVRVAGVADRNRAVKYYTDTVSTNEGKREIWAFVMFPDEDVSKDMYAMSDAQASFATGEEPRQRILVNFEVAVIFPTTKLGGIDEVEDSSEMRNKLIASLVGLKSTEEDADVTYKTVYSGSEMNSYDTATYIRVYRFQTPFDITFRQTVDNYPLTTALRKATMSLVVENDSIDAEIDT